MKARALLLATLLLLAILPSALSTGAEEGEDRRTDLVRVKLYAHIFTNNAFLNTLQSSANVRSDTLIDFTSIELRENLRVHSVPTDVGKNDGFIASIGVTAPVQGARVTVQVRDNDQVVANRTRNLSPLDTHWDWRLPFTDRKDTYTFLKRHTITLRVSADRTVIVRTNQDSYLELFCEDHLDITLETVDVDRRSTTTFYPNDMLEQRNVTIVGDIIDPFGQGDIGGVNISIRRPDGQYAVQDQEAEIGDAMNYTYEWLYGTGLPSGTYKVNATGRDQQGHEYTVVSSFIMAEYGVRISAEDEEAGVIMGTTTPGSPAKYTLTILNVGGKNGEIELSNSALPPLWSASFSKTTFSLPTGQDEDVTFDVKPELALGGGNVSITTVTVTVTNDPNTPKAKDFLQVETSVRDDYALQVLPTNPDPKTVGVGGQVDHFFTLRNVGEERTTVDLSMTGVPTGWQAEFRGERVTGNSVEDLRTMEVVDIVLRVRTSTTSTTRKAIIKVECRSHEDPDIKKEITFETNLVIGLVLNATTPTTDKLDPGDNYILRLDAYNNDPNSEHDISFSVVQKATSWPSTSFRFTPSTLVRLDPESTSEIGLEVNVPENAEPDEFGFTVKGVVDNLDQVSDSIDFTLEIETKPELEVTFKDGGGTIRVGTQEESVIFLDLENKGNVQETVNITVEVDGENVDVWINDAKTSFVPSLRLSPGGSEEVKIAFRAVSEATHKDEMIVRITVEGMRDSTPEQNDFKLVVEKSSSERFMDFLDQFWVMILLLVVMVIAMIYVYKPRGGRPSEEKEDKESAMGTSAKM